MLFAESVGTGPPVVLVHGFTQTHHTWRPVVDRLQGLYRFTMVDAPGHGASTMQGDSDDDSHDDSCAGTGDGREGAAPGDGRGLWAQARLVGERGGVASYVGYSMGARLCLHLALQRPDLVRCLVLVGVHPGIADPVERAARRDDEESQARHVLADGVPAFVDWWLSRPLFSTLAPERAQRGQRLENTATGLASSLRLAGTGQQEPLWDRLSELTMPVLLVAGELDDKFVGLARRMGRRIGPNAEVVLIPGAGHACHLERPDAFCLTLSDFLADAATGR